MVGRSVGKSKKLKTSQDFEHTKSHTKSQESKHQNGGAQMHGTRP